MKFKDAVVRNIRQTVAKLKGQGTVGMSVANLQQITPTPKEVLPGAPSGPAGYSQVFAEAVKEVTTGLGRIKNFDIYESV